MKKRDLIVLWGIVIIAAVILGRAGLDETKSYSYQTKDAYKVYGNGTFQIFDGNDNNGNVIRGLSDCEYDDFLIYDIKGITEAEDFLYAYGLTYDRDAYAVVNLTDDTFKFFVQAAEGEEDYTPDFISSKDMIENGDLILLSGFEEFTPEEQAELEILKNGGGTEVLGLE